MLTPVKEELFFVARMAVLKSERDGEGMFRFFGAMSVPPKCLF